MSDPGALTGPRAMSALSPSRAPKRKSPNSHHHFKSRLVARPTIRELFSRRMWVSELALIWKARREATRRTTRKKPAKWTFFRPAHAARHGVDQIVFDVLGDASIKKLPRVRILVAPPASLRTSSPGAHASRTTPISRARPPTKRPPCAAQFGSKFDQIGRFRRAFSGPRLSSGCFRCTSIRR